ncbi:MAG: hypothetical protein WDM76_08815 [Limisphaerales bacterium]
MTRPTLSKLIGRTTIDGCRPLISPHFNLTVELPAQSHRARL